MEVLWIRLPKVPGSAEPLFGGAGRLTRGRLLVLIDRGDYWQSAYLVRKGGFDSVEAAGIEAFRAVSWSCSLVWTGRSRGSAAGTTSRCFPCRWTV
jgi:hypothetical protein